MSSVGSDSLIGGFLTPSDIEEGEDRYAWITRGDGGSPQKNLIKVKFCPLALVHLQGERERSVVDGGRQANATSAASDPLLFPPNHFPRTQLCWAESSARWLDLFVSQTNPPFPLLVFLGAKNNGQCEPVAKPLQAEYWTLPPWGAVGLAVYVCGE